MRHSRTFATLAAIGSLVCTASAGPFDPTGFGARVSAVGDVDGDGVPDFAAASAKGGDLRVCSGKDGKVLWRTEGFDATGVPDQDGDGKADVVVATDAPGKIDGAWAKVCSGATGAELATIKPSTRDVIGTRPYTSTVASLGDVDGDGKTDLLVLRVAPVSHAVPGLTQWCDDAKVFVVSVEGKVVATPETWVDRAYRDFIALPGFDADGDGRTDVLLRTDANQTRLGLSIVSAVKGVVTEYKGDLSHTPDAIAVLGDLDGDKKPEFLFGKVLASRGESEYAGEVRIVAGKDAKTVLRVIKGEKKMEAFGTSIASLGDADGDGFPDFAAGAFGAAGKDEFECGAVRAYSGKTGKLLWNVKRSTSRAQLGWSLAAIGDVDADGVTDLVAGAPGIASVLLISGKTGNVIAAVN